MGLDGAKRDDTGRADHVIGADKMIAGLWKSIIFLCFLVTGCAATPSILDELQPTLKPTGNIYLSDLGVLRYGEKVKNGWGQRSTNADVFELSSQVAVAALTTGSLAAAGLGAANGITVGMTGGTSFILQLLGIIQPVQRANAFGEGTQAINTAMGEYLAAITKRKISMIPTNRVTPEAGQMYAKIKAAENMVSNLMNGIRTRTSDDETLNKKIETPESFRDEPPPCTASCQ